MVGGTKLPPQDSVSEPGCYERKTRATARTKAKTLYEGKRQKPSPLYVSLDNADTVIDGGPTRWASGLRPLSTPNCCVGLKCREFRRRRSRGNPCRRRLFRPDGHILGTATLHTIAAKV